MQALVRFWWCLVIGSLLLAIALPQRYNWHPSEQIHYSVHLESVQQVDFDALAQSIGDDAATPSTQKRAPYLLRTVWRAQLHLTLLARLPDQGWLIAGRLHRVRLQLQVNNRPTDPAALQRLTRAQEQLTLFLQTSAAGRIQAVWFAGNSDTDAHDLTRAVLARLQVVWSESPSEATWRTIEDAPEGAYEAVYETTSASPLRLRKTRARYTQIARPVHPEQSLRPFGAVLITWDTRLQRLQELRGRWRTEAWVRQRQIGMEETVIGVRLIGTASVSASRVQALRQRHQRVQAQREGLQAPERPFTETQRRALAIQTLGRETAQSLTERTLQLGVQASAEQVGLLTRQWAALFLVEPRAVSVAETLAMRVSAQSAAAQVVLAALAQASHEAAQGVLVRLTLSYYERGDALAYGTAIAYLAFVETPTSTTERALFQLADDPRREYAYPARLVLGSVGRALHASAPQRARAIGAWAAQQLRMAQSEDDQELWLQVLGNLGVSEVGEWIAPYLQHSSARLRAAAVGALRLVGGAAAEQALLEALLRDAERSVRYEAAAAFTHRALTQRAVEAFGEALRQELDKDVRRALLERLASTTEYRAEARAVLEWAAAYDMDESLRLWAQGVLQGWR